MFSTSSYVQTPMYHFLGRELDSNLEISKAKILVEGASIIEPEG